MIAHLLLEKIPLAGIARVLQLSQSWLQHYVNVCYDNVPRSVQVTPKPLLKKTTLERCSMICSRCKLPSASGERSRSGDSAGSASVDNVRLEATLELALGDRF